MSVYQRPYRSDELYHWGKGQESKFHKYIAKIGNRYFYTQEEVDAFKREKAMGATLRDKADTQRQQAKQARKDAVSEDSKTVESFFKKNYSFLKSDRQQGARDQKRHATKYNYLQGREKRLNQAAQASEKAAVDHDNKAQDIVKNKSLLTQVAFKRAVEKEDRDKAKEQKRQQRKKRMESGRQKVLNIFRKKGWIF